MAVNAYVYARTYDRCVPGRFVSVVELLLDVSDDDLAQAVFAQMKQMEHYRKDNFIVHYCFADNLESVLRQWMLPSKPAFSQRKASEALAYQKKTSN